MISGVQPYWLDYPAQKVMKFFKDAECELVGNRDLWIEQRRFFAANDLFYLLVYVCGREDLVHPWLFDRIREVQKDPDGRLDLWAREHGKSSCITFGMTLLDIINNPDITIGIFSHTRDIAKGFLRQIMRELEQNKKLVDLFPEIFWENPRTQSPKWSESDGLIVKRQFNTKECTVEAWGLVDGMPTSRHFDLRVYDDIVTDKSVNTPEMIKRTTDAWALSVDLGKKGGKERTVGTRYNKFDTYGEIISRKAAKPRIYPATSDGTLDFTKAVLLDPEQLEEKYTKQGPYIFACQQLLNPTADKAMGFSDEWLAYHPNKNHDNLFKFILVDPSSGRNKGLGTNTRDYTAIWVIGYGSDLRYRVLDMVRDRLNLVSRQQEVERLSRKHQTLLVFYEQTGMQADIEHFNYVGSNVHNYSMDMVEVAPIGSKRDRIMSLVPLFTGGRIMLPESLLYISREGTTQDLVRVFIEEEYSQFPVLVHDDMLDALAQLTNPVVTQRIVAPKPQRREDIYDRMRRLQRKASPVV